MWLGVLLQVNLTNLNAGFLLCFCWQIAFFVGAQLDVTSSVSGHIGEVGSVPDIRHLGVVGAVKVAVRGLHGDGLRRRMHKNE